MIQSQWWYQWYQLLMLTHQLIPLQLFLHKMILLSATSILPCTILLFAAEWIGANQLGYNIDY